MAAISFYSILISPSRAILRDINGLFEGATEFGLLKFYQVFEEFMTKIANIKKNDQCHANDTLMSIHLDSFLPYIYV